MENIGGVTANNERDREYWRRFGIQVNENGILLDQNPVIIQRTLPDAQTVPRRINVRFLQPPPLEPHGDLRQVPGPIQVIPGAPIRRTEREPVRKPADILLVEEPPTPPPREPPRTVTVPSAPLRLPRTTVIDRYKSAPLLPDVYIERWLPYGPRPKGQVVVVPAPPPPAPPQLHNIINIYTPEVRYQREVRRFGVTVEDPIAYRQRHAGRLLDSQTLLARTERLGIVRTELDLPPRIPDGPGNFALGGNEGDVLYPQQ